MFGMLLLFGLVFVFLLGVALVDLDDVLDWFRP